MVEVGGCFDCPNIRNSGSLASPRLQVVLAMEITIIQQLREAFPFDAAPRYAILDRDGKYGKVVPSVLENMGVLPV